MEKLTDGDLRSQLICFGEDVGPINASTRPYWEKRLEQLMQPTASKKKTATKTTSKKKDKSTSRNRKKQIEKEPVQNQKQKDKKLVDDLKKFGIKVPRGPFNDEVRVQYQKKLDNLKPKDENRHLEGASVSSKHESPKYFKYNIKLVDDVKKNGFKSQRGPLTDDIRAQCQKKRDNFKSEGSEPINDFTVFGTQLPLKRHAKQEKLDQIIDGTSRIGRNNKHTSPKRQPPPQIMHEHIHHLQDDELRDNLMAYGIHVPRDALNDTTRNPWMTLLRQLMSGASPENNSMEH